MTDFQTLLVLSGMGIPLYSSRGARMALSPIAASVVLRRDVNGELDDLSDTAFQKYAIKITCSDQITPAIDGIWPGALITIDSNIELAYMVGGHQGRDEVSGSSRTDGDFVYYRPVFVARCINFSSEFDEWNATYNWEIDFEEL